MLPFINILGRQIPMYGLMMTLGVIVAFLISSYRCKKAGLLVEDLLTIIATALGWALLGGWIFYLFATYSFSGVIELVRNGEIVGLIGGGIVFYGGLVSGFIGAFLGSKIAKVSLTDFLNPVIPTLPLAHAFGRIGCFFAGCCYGIPTDSPLGVIYKNPVGGTPVNVSLLPVQLIEAALNIVLFIILLLFTSGSKSKTRATYLYFLLYALMRFILEFFRYDEIRGKFSGISTSQWISLVIIAFILLRLLFKRFFNTRANAFPGSW
ncbi:MAG: prolipoprotein diacylglyceryl transferase [Peptococcia bacterium]